MLKNTRQICKVALVFACATLFLAPVASAADVSGSISGNTTWDLSGSPYIVTGDVTVEAGVTLTVRAGVLIKFDTGTSLTISGNLVATGTEQNSIIFSSNQAVPNPGDWAGIRFGADSVGTMRNCVVQYANYGVYIYGNGEHRIESSVLRYNNRKVYLLNYGTRPDPVISNNSLYENTYNLGVALLRRPI